MNQDEINNVQSPNLVSDGWNATDEGPQFSERQRPFQAGGFNLPSTSPTSISYASSDDSAESESYPCEHYRLQIEHSLHIRDLKSALRQLQTAIEEHESLSDSFEGNCQPRNLDAWSHIQACFERRIHTACAAVQAQTKDMDVLGGTPEQFSQRWHDAENSGVDRKEGVDALLRPLLIAVVDRLGDLERVNPDEEMRLQEAGWAKQYFLRCRIPSK